jgi:hypothetical protein
MGLIINSERAFSLPVAIASGKLSSKGSTGCNGVYLWEKSLILNGVQAKGLFHLSERELTVGHRNSSVYVDSLQVHSILGFRVGWSREPIKS